MITEAETHCALAKLLSVLAGTAYKVHEKDQSLPQQFERCIQRVKIEASEAMALIEACAPHSKAMLTQAQQKLEALSELQVLHQLALERFGTN